MVQSIKGCSASWAEYRPKSGDYVARGDNPEHYAVLYSAGKMVRVICLETQTSPWIHMDECVPVSIDQVAGNLMNLPCTFANPESAQQCEGIIRSAELERHTGYIRTLHVASGDALFELPLSEITITGRAEERR